MDHTDTRPPLVDMPGTMRQIPVKSRTSIYKLTTVPDDETGEPPLTAVKVGARTFITQESIDRFVERLTAAASAKQSGGT